MKPKLTETERFWKHVQKLSGDNACWIWTAGGDKNSYGLFKRTALPGKKRGIQVRAHRYSWELYIGRPAPDFLEVCHTCDHPSCVNPHHLFLGTTKENAEDRQAKGRGAEGLRHGMTKLTESDVHIIRASTKNNSELSRQFGVTRRQIVRIKKGLLWKSLPFQPCENVDLDG